MKATKSYFSLDGSTIIYQGYTFGEDWNGWSVPYFELSEALQVAEETHGIYEEESESFVFVSWGVAEAIRPTRISTEEGFKTVYPIGAYSWVWNELP